MGRGAPEPLEAAVVSAGEVEEPLIMGTPYCSQTALTVLVTELW
jgi:hypothetical protein